MSTDEVLRYRVRHTTCYRYEVDVTTGYNEARLLPRTTPTQRVVTARLDVDPAPADRRDRLDHFGNPTTYLAVHAPHRQLVATATAEVHVRRPEQPWVAASSAPGAEGRSAVEPSAPWEEVAEALAWPPGPTPPGAAPVADPEVLAARQLVLPSPLVPAAPALAELAEGAFTPGRPVVAAAVALCHDVHRAIAYEPGSTGVHTRPDEALAQGRGVCQDLAHVLVGALRSRGLAARYVSGYLETDPPPGRPRLVGADATHAWASLLVPGRGWLDLDPTNDAVPDGRHLVLAWGRDFADVTPLKGVVYAGVAHHELEVAVDVERLA